MGSHLKSIAVFLNEPLTVRFGYTKKIADKIEVLNTGKMFVQVRVVRNIRDP
ncbi:hypothetical protein D3C79_1067420 [compost metagenome]